MKYDSFFEDWHPAENDLRYNEVAVNEFVEKMADNNLNAYAVFLLLTRRTQFDINQVRYNARIAENLIEAENISLGRAKGIVTGHYKESAFRFYPKGVKVGNIEIIHPPVIYDATDKHLLKGVIIHELRHAQDFAEGRQVDAVSYRFDPQTYMYSLSEARAWADQLMNLVSSIDSPEKVIQALNQQPRWDNVEQMKQAKRSPFRLPPELLHAAKVFLKNFNFNESMASWAAAPIVAASMMLPQMSGPVKNQAIQAVESRKATIDELVAKIFTKLQFKNFVIKP